MFRKVKTYLVFNKPELPESADALNQEPVIIADSFNFKAFIFHILWALYHRLWKTVTLLVLSFGGLQALESYGILSKAASQPIQLGVLALLGFSASGMLSRKLEGKGYTLDALIVAESPESAELRYFEKLERL
jgi:hypothetical protein